MAVIRSKKQHPITLLSTVSYKEQGKPLKKNDRSLHEIEYQNMFCLPHF
jgi:hypothetical protein